MSVNSEKYCCRLLLTAFIVAILGSTVDGQVYNQYPCPPCPIHSPCPPCPPQYYPTYPAPWGRGSFPQPPFAGQTAPPFNPRAEGSGGYGGYDGNRQEYSNQAGPQTVESGTGTSETGASRSDSQPNADSNASGSATNATQGNSQTNVAAMSSQGNRSPNPGFGDAAQAGMTRVTGSAVPNMIGDSTSIPTRMLSHTYYTIETVQIPNVNYNLPPNWMSFDQWCDNEYSQYVADFIPSSNYPDPLPFESFLSDLDTSDYPWDGQQFDDRPTISSDQRVAHHETVPFSSTPSMVITMLNGAENFNAEVQDRVYFDLRFFGGAQGYGASTDCNDDRVPTSDLARATMGFEKSFFRRRCSLELRLPVVMNLNSDHDASTIGSTRGNQLGNISLIFKNAFRQGRNYTLSRGFGINLPTAPGMRLAYRGGQGEPVQAYIDNNKTSLVPFFGMQWHPENSRNFGHAVAQLDIALGANRMRFSDTSLSGRREEYCISLNESTLARINLGGGRWLIQQETESSRFKLGIMAECHYTANLDKLSSRNIFSYDPANPNYFTASATKGGWQMINLVFGIPIQTQHTSFMAFVTTPITSTRYFDVEGGFTFDVRF